MNRNNTISLNRQILKLSIPAIATNITVPLLGLCDTAISGHLGSAAYMSAIAAGSMMVNVIVWLCSFLRMGTSGITAEAFGQNSRSKQSAVLFRSMLLAIAIGALVILFSRSIENILLCIISASAETENLASLYFTTCVWSIPPLLCILSTNGWFIGMQDTIRPMIISISMNIINIGASLICVFVFNMGFKGVALGTVIANWITLVIAVVLLCRFSQRLAITFSFHALKSTTGICRFFKTNTDLFFRSACIMGVSFAVTAYGARLGDLILAANAIIMQFFIIFSYITDGFAYAAEALTGKFQGAQQHSELKETILSILKWGLYSAIAFTLVYVLFHKPLINLLTDSRGISNTCNQLSVFIILLPGCSFAAFIFDGIFIGLVRTRRMLVTTLIATVIFFSIIFIPSVVYHTDVTIPNDCLPPIKSDYFLWTAFLAYLIARGIGLGLQLPKFLRLND